MKYQVHYDWSSDANGNTPSDYIKADKGCPKGYIVVWNRYEKGFRYRKLDKDGNVIEDDGDGMEVTEIIWREKKYYRDMATGDLYTEATNIKIGTMGRHGNVVLLEEGVW